MAAPSFVQAGSGVVNTTTIAGGVFNGTVTVGNVLIVQVLQDGTGTDAALDPPANADRFEALDGTNDTLTKIGTFDVGSAVAAKQHLWIGRALHVAPAPEVVSSSGDDIYARLYEFSGVHTGSALSDVIENSSAGSAVNGAGTSASVLDTGVTTLGADRLACNFIAVNDDNNLELTAMTGETGGDWTYPVTAFGSSTGTDGAIALVTATIASAGTIDGGSDAITSDAWGVVGFALIPAAAAAPASLIYQPGTELAIPRSLYRR